MYVQDALEEAQGDPTITQIWVAQGTYYPDDGLDDPPANPREATFQLLDGVGIYGGFVGNEVLRSERDPETNITILSGDIGVPGDNTDNVYTVVEADGVGASTALNGFTVTLGMANGPGGGGQPRGGGMYIHGTGFPRVVRCRFTDNFALLGGGLYMANAEPAIVNCSFVGNTASVAAAGVFSGGSSFGPITQELTGCVFTGNVADDNGGAIAVGPSVAHTLVLKNCTFSGNTATLGCGGAVYVGNNDEALLTNCIMWGNFDSGGCYNGPESTIYLQSESASATVSYSCVQHGVPGPVTDGGGNISDDPMYCDADGVDDEVGTADDNLSLSLGSPCIDAGLDSAVPSDVGDVDDDGNILETLPWDLHKQNRLFDAVPGISTDDVDMGAYEDQHLAACPADFDGDGDVGPFDLAVLLDSWGPCPGCRADFDCDNDVGAFDLAFLLNSWGPCGGLGASGGSGPMASPAGPGGGG